MQMLSSPIRLTACRSTIKLMHGCQKMYDRKCRTCVLLFDLSGVLETGPYDDELLKYWMLYLPDGNVYTYRSDGAVSFGLGERNEKDWAHGG